MGQRYVVFSKLVFAGGVCPREYSRLLATGADAVDREQTCIIRRVPEHPWEPVGGAGWRVRHHLRRALETVAFIAPGCGTYL